MSKASLTKNPAEVAEMFNRVARKYDLTNDVLALGFTYSWRKKTAKELNPKYGELILDVAAGTGTSSNAFTKSGAKIISCDFSMGMLTEGKKRYSKLNFTAADALKLPFADNTFDSVTISFGIRNVNNVKQALSEMSRVTKSGGKIVICEFSTPVIPVFKFISGPLGPKAVKSFSVKFNFGSINGKFTYTFSGFLVKKIFACDV